MYSSHHQLCSLLLALTLLTWQPVAVYSEVLVMPSSEKKLIKKLVDNYEKIGKIGRPVRHSTDTINVGFGLALFQILDFNEKEQVITINVWSKYTWMDQLLQWDPSNYSNIREVRIPPKLVWTPDIVLHNYLDLRLKEHRDVMLTVDYRGRVYWSPPAIFKSNCQVDIKYFPFDYQFCFFQFASLTQDGQQLDLRFLDNRTEVDIDQYTPNNEWHIVARPASRFLLKVNCDKTTPVLWFFLYLKRNPAYRVYILVFPCILLSLLNTVIFWLPPQNPAKVLLSMNIFVAFSVLLKLLAQSTPSASVIVPMLGYFYCLNMALISLSTFSSTMVIKLHFRSQKHGPVPNWLLKIVYHLSEPLSIGLPDEDEDVTPTLSQLEVELRNSTAKVIRFQPHVPYSSGLAIQGQQALNGRQMLPPFNMLYPGKHQQVPLNRCGLFGGNHPFTDQMMLAQQADVSRIPPSEKVYSPGRELAVADDRNPLGSTAGLDEEEKPGNSFPPLLNTGIHSERSKLHSVKIALQSVMIKVMKKDLEAKRSREWRLVIMTIDRLIFWVYMAIITISVCYLLIPRGEGQTVEQRIDAHSKNYLQYNTRITNKCPIGHRL